VTVDPGTSLATQGENAYQLFVIESGHAEVSKDGEFVTTSVLVMSLARSVCSRPAPVRPLSSRPR